MGTTVSPARRGSALQGGLVMFVLFLLLSWVPVIGPFAAGFVGGRIVGDGSRAVGVALIPAILLGVILGFVLAAFELPVLGAVAGIGLAIVIVVQEIPLLVGAGVGGATSDRPLALPRGGAR